MKNKDEKMNKGLENMQTYPECFNCFTKLIYNSIQPLGFDEREQFDLMQESLNIVLSYDMSIPPAVIGGKVFGNIVKTSGVTDLFLEIKKESTRIALGLYPQLKACVSQADDPLDMAIRISALGNLMDVANPNSYDLDEEIDNISKQPIHGGGLKLFRERLKTAKRLLILGDNTGETVFDRVLIETLDMPVTYAVKGSPILNDATLQEALDAGLDQCAEIISNGAAIAGTHLPYCSEDFKAVFEDSDLILSKGQGNYETLSDVEANVFFLLRVKCEALSKDIGIPVGSMALKPGLLKT
ncbi:MAG: DUF89 family protein [Anaerolineaceae bacterium]|nr:DUF89 family protein [Anaerolineaceae bacterium]